MTVYIILVWKGSWHIASEEADAIDPGPHTLSDAKGVLNRHFEQWPEDNRTRFKIWKAEGYPR